MAEQSSITLSGLPIAGATISATDGQDTAIRQIADEFNKQIPITKISAETPFSVWATSTSGWTADPTTRTRYLAFGPVIFIDLALTGTSDSVNTTFTLPFVPKSAAFLPCVKVVDGGTTQNTLGALVMTAGSLTVVVRKNNSGDAWTNSGGKSVDAAFWYERNI